MLQKLELYGFRAFGRFTVTFGRDAFMVGANNAGKSTIIAAIRAVARMLSIAKNRRPDGHERDRERSHPVYRFATPSVDLPIENLRHELRNQETRIAAHFNGGASIVAVWPPASQDENFWEVEPFFYVSVQDRSQPTSPKQVRELFPTVGVIPLLGPVDMVESLLSEKHVRENVDGRLASRHFRNQLHLLLRDQWPWSGTYGAYQALVDDWAPEVAVDTPRLRIGGGGAELDVFHTEEGSRSERELVWAGDGIQVWLQLIFHLYRLRDADTVVLDEPDLYLHPDLQRRLVHLLESRSAQTVAATHSPEVLAEAHAESVVWVDKSKTRARRGPKAADLGNLATAIGSQFNLKVAKALRSKIVLFVEGKDMRIFRTIALHIGAINVANERRITVVPLEGYTNWSNVSPFAWLVTNLLEDSVQMVVTLDRDYRPEEAVAMVKDKLAEAGVECHVWRRKELESYLLLPETIARVSGASPRDVTVKLMQIASSQRARVLARRIDAAEQVLVTKQRHRVNVMEEIQARFESDWSNPDNRPMFIPAKEALSQLNSWLQEEGLKAVSSRSLAACITPNEVSDEMRAFIEDIEERLR